MPGYYYLVYYLDNVAHRASLALLTVLKTVNVIKARTGRRWLKVSLMSVLNSSVRRCFPQR